MPKETFLNLPKEKQDKIVLEAIKEFAYKGFNNGNIGTIAKNAGVSKGSMYQYFDDKKELYLHCIMWSYETSLNMTLVKGYDTMPLYDYFVISFKLSWPFLTKYRDVYIFLENVAFEASKLNIDALNILLTKSENFTLELIKKNQKNGYLRTDLDAKTLLIYIEGVVQQFKKEMAKLAKAKHKEIINTTYEEYENLIADMIKLLKTGTDPN